MMCQSDICFITIYSNIHKHLSNQTKHQCFQQNSCGFEVIYCNKVCLQKGWINQQMSHFIVFIESSAQWIFVQFFYTCLLFVWVPIRGIMHSLFFRGHELGGGGGSSCDTQQPQLHLCFLYFFLFILNIPKRINYIMKYLDSHLYRLC